LEHRKIDATLEHRLESGRQSEWELHCCNTSKQHQQGIKRRSRRDEEEIKKSRGDQEEMKKRSRGDQEEIKRG